MGERNKFHIRGGQYSEIGPAKLTNNITALCILN